AQAKCLAEAPEYKEVSPGHWASCHFPFPDPADAKAVGIRAMPETGSAPKVDDKALHAGSRDRF
ncbi:MAG: hypothetical protein P8Q36_14260, partial [Alphaproteobacteria bacterium]|nr:hypothetical protein [Alphaproteobacteria bacterium]